MVFSGNGGGKKIIVIDQVLTEGRLVNTYVREFTNFIDAQVAYVGRIVLALRTNGHIEDQT
jgi:hypothetical protein